MKNNLLIFCLLTFVFTSCISLQDREMTSNDLSLQVLGTVSEEFVSFHPLHIQSPSFIKNTAYKKLLNEAIRKYGSRYGNDVIDVMNIKITNEPVVPSFIPLRVF